MVPSKTTPSDGTAKERDAAVLSCRLILIGFSAGHTRLLRRAILHRNARGRIRPSPPVAGNDTPEPDVGNHLNYRDFFNGAR